MSVYWLSSATRTPPRVFSQKELFQYAGYETFPPEERHRIQAVFRAVGVNRRAMWLSEKNYNPTTDPDDFHSRYISGIREIVPPVAREALEKAGLQGSDLDFIVFSSCTGYTCPGYSVELAYTLGMPEDRPTANLLGMGCSSLVPAIERAWDHLTARPGLRALVVSAEICSATYWIDHDPETALGNALFGDGAAAVILSSRKEDISQFDLNRADLNRVDLNRADQNRADQNRGPVAEIEGFRTLRDGRYLFDMGFNQKQGRLKVRLSSEIPDRIVPLALQMIKLLELDENSRVAVHPGGKRILDLMGDALSRDSEKWNTELNYSRSILREYGNMSSPTVAFVLQRSILERPVVPNEVGALITMGPGLSVEGMRMRWLG